MSENPLIHVGRLHMRLRELKLRMADARSEGIIVASKLRAISDALDPPEDEFISPILHASDTNFSIGGYDDGSGEKYPKISYPDVKEIIQHIFDLGVEIENTERELDFAERETKMPWDE